MPVGIGRFCLLASAFLLGVLLLDLPAATGTEAKKSGVCPELQADPNCTKECVSDSDCADTRKCCQAGCSTLCSVPNEKAGTCPSVDFPQLGICEDQCEMDSQCPGKMKCCRNGCGKVSCVIPNF
ncbi:WAP four-disulfide core domain protein 2 [Castor canadensis]|uniref:WAP four-disulfide core domain protein 2 n=1 Tax=Castor canadensis TaxID=51338 RepID=A0A8B7UVA9_CASCN